MTTIPQNPIAALPKPREMDQIIAQWLGWTEIQADDGAIYGRTVEGQLKVVPLYSTSRYALYSALEAVETRGLSFRLHCFLRRGEVQIGNRKRCVSQTNDGLD